MKLTQKTQSKRVIENLLRCLGLFTLDCENLHHVKKHQHEGWETCPVEVLLEDNIKYAKEYLENFSL